MAVELYDDIEQSERVKRWIREYAMAVLIGVALAFAGIYGLRYWKSYQTSQNQAAAERYALFQELLEEDDSEQAEAMYSELREGNAGHAYTALAGLEMAGEYVESEQLDEAAGIYRDVLAQGKFSALHPVARLRLARVQLSQGDPDAALATLGGDAPAGFAAAYAEVRGDIEAERGNREQARLAYQEAMDNLLPGGAGASFLLELKLGSLETAGNES